MLRRKTHQRPNGDFMTLPAFCVFFSLLSDVDGVVVAAAIPLLYRSLISCCMLLLLRRKSIEICSQRMGRQRVFFFFTRHTAGYFIHPFLPFHWMFTYHSSEMHSRSLTHTHSLPRINTEYCKLFEFFLQFMTGILYIIFIFFLHLLLVLLYLSPFIYMFFLVYWSWTLLCVE